MAGRKTAAERAADKSPSTEFRGRLAVDVEAEYEAIVAVLRTALQSTKKVRVQRDCPKCGCNHIDYVLMQNVADAIKAAEFFQNQAFGRPGEDQAQRGAGDFVVERYVVEPPEKA